MFYYPLKRYILFPFFRQNASRFSISNETLCNYQCYLLYQQFGNIGNVIEKRRQNAAYYMRNLGDTVATPVETDGGKHVYFRYALQVDRKNELCNYLLKCGIEADTTFDHCLADEGACPESEAVTRRNLNIPVHHELSARDLERVVEAIHRFGTN